MTATAPSASTLSLFPQTPPELEPEEVALTDLPADAVLLGPPPGAALVASIRQCGVLQPVLVLRSPTGTLLVADGRRRVKAARVAALDTIPARVAPDDGSLGALLGLLTHGTRRDNPAAELDAIEHLLQAGASEPAIAHATGLSPTTIQRRLRLHHLAPALRDAYRQGHLTTSVAESAAKLPAPAQARLAMQLAEQGRLTGSDVADERRVRQEAAVAALPLALLATGDEEAPPAGREAPAESVMLVSGWLEAALQPTCNRQVRDVVALEGGTLLVHLAIGGACTIRVTTGVGADDRGDRDRKTPATAGSD